MTCYIASTLLREHWWPGTHCAAPAGIPVDWPARIAGPTPVACSTVGVATRICSRLPVQKLLPRPQGPEHPGHWRSGQARAGMGLKLKEEAKKSREESIKIFAAADFKAALRRKARQCAVVKVFNLQTAMLLSACCLLDSMFIS